MAEQDFRTTFRGRRQAWFGLKPLVKTALSGPVLHPVVRLGHAAVPKLRSGRLPAPASLAEVHGVAAGARFVLVDPDRCEIAKELYWGKGRRPSPRDAFALDLMVALSRDADVFFDVGAYTGVFSLAALAGNPQLRAHAFEMIPAVADGLLKNVERNGMSDRVTIHRTGVGRAGDTMRVPSGEGGSALPSFYSARMEFSEGDEVEFVSLDSCIPAMTEPAQPDPAQPEPAQPEPAQAEPALRASALPGASESVRVTMKIDVEGAEDQVLSHGQEFLATFAPDILCEVLPGEADGALLESLLRPHGYTWYVVRDGEIAPRESIVPVTEHRDWLFTTRTPEELEAAVGPVIARD